MKALERNSNYLRSHGSYIDDWRVRESKDSLATIAVLSRVMLLTEEVARHMIAEAIARVDIEAYGALFGLDSPRYDAHDRAHLAQSEVKSWMMPGNKDFVIFRVTNSPTAPLAFGIYQHDYRTYLIEGKVELIRRFHGGHLAGANRRLSAALDGNFTGELPEEG
jgi:hypothetical protein